MNSTEKLMLRFLRDSNVPGSRPLTRRAALAYMRVMGPGERQELLARARNYYRQEKGKVKPVSQVVEQSLSPLPSASTAPDVSQDPESSVSDASASRVLKASRSSGRPSLPANQRKKLVSVYLDPAHILGLERLVNVTGRTAAHHIREALARYLESEARAGGQSSNDGVSHSSDES